MIYIKKTIYSVYTLQPPRRLEDFAAIKITTENDPQILKLKNNNFLILNNNTPPQFDNFDYHKYKT